MAILPGRVRHLFSIMTAHHECSDMPQIVAGPRRLDAPPARCHTLTWKGSPGAIRDPMERRSPRTWMAHMLARFVSHALLICLASQAPCLLSAQDQQAWESLKPRLLLTCPISPCRFRQGEIIP